MVNEAGYVFDDNGLPKESKYSDPVFGRFEHNKDLSSWMNICYPEKNDGVNHLLDVVMYHAAKGAATDIRSLSMLRCQHGRMKAETYMRSRDRTLGKEAYEGDQLYDKTNMMQYFNHTMLEIENEELNVPSMQHTKYHMVLHSGTENNLKGNMKMKVTDLAFNADNNIIAEQWIYKYMGVLGAVRNDYPAAKITY